MRLGCRSMPSNGCQSSSGSVGGLGHSESAPRSPAPGWSETLAAIGRNNRLQRDKLDMSAPKSALQWKLSFILEVLCLEATTRGGQHSANRKELRAFRIPR
jgi:hypothetical protein